MQMTPSDSTGPKIEGRRKQLAIIFHGTELYRFEVPMGRKANFQKIGVK